MNRPPPRIPNLKPQIANQTVLRSTRSLLPTNNTSTLLHVMAAYRPKSHFRHLLLRIEKVSWSQSVSKSKPLLQKRHALWLKSLFSPPKWRATTANCCRWFPEQLITKVAKRNPIKKLRSRCLMLNLKERSRQGITQTGHSRLYLIPTSATLLSRHVQSVKAGPKPVTWIWPCQLLRRLRCANSSHARL